MELKPTHRPQVRAATVLAALAIAIPTTSAAVPTTLSTADGITVPAHADAPSHHTDEHWFYD
jgi:hypothetical protein